MQLVNKPSNDGSGPGPPSQLIQALFINGGNDNFAPWFFITAGDEPQVKDFQLHQFKERWLEEVENDADDGDEGS